MDVKLTPSEKITKAKIMLRQTQPFFSRLMLSLECIEEKDAKKIPTAGVNAKGQMFYNYDFIDKMKLEEVKGVVTHEVMHCAFGHLIRTYKGYDHTLLNVAQDIIINHYLSINGFKLPEGVLMPQNNEIKLKGKGGKEFTIKDISSKTSLQIYDELKKHAEIVKQYGVSGGKGESGIGNIDSHQYGDREGNDFSKSDQKKIQEDWKRKMASAAEYAQKQQGKCPAGFDRLIDQLLNPKIRWNEYLYKYISNILPLDYTYMRRSKRSMATGFYMPGVLKEKLEICASIDTSGSMSQKDLKEAMTELHQISKLSPNIEIKIAVCDAEVHEVYKLTDSSLSALMKINLKGGGGTSHIPIYEWMEKKQRGAKVLINFTDGYTDFPKNRGFRFESIWVLTGTGKNSKDIPFGRVLTLDKSKSEFDGDDE